MRTKEIKPYGLCTLVCGGILGAKIYVTGASYIVTLGKKKRASYRASKRLFHSWKLCNA